jgi:hypothetical protein
VPPLYGFLGEGAVAFLSGFRWPQPTDREPGPWVRAGADAPGEVVRGVPVEQLPWWFDDELWELELEGSVVSAGRAVTADRARLVRRVDAWTPEAANELVAACEQRVREAALDGYADDVVLYAKDAGRPAAAAAVAAYIAAHALAGGEKDAPGYKAGFERERRWQVAWLKRRLQL